MRLSFIVVVACTVLVTGCATQHPSTLRNKESVAEYSSTNNAKTVALCIADGWEKNGNMVADIKMRPSANGYSVWLDISMGVLLKNETVQLVDVDDTQFGSNTHFYGGGGSNEWRLVVDRCAGNTTDKASVASERAPSDTPTSSSTSQKMRELQGLRKEGLITEEEFQKKKQQLLEKL